MSNFIWLGRDISRKANLNSQVFPIYWLKCKFNWNNCGLFWKVNNSGWCFMCVCVCVFTSWKTVRTLLFKNWQLAIFWCVFVCANGMTFNNYSVFIRIAREMDWQQFCILMYVNVVGLWILICTQMFLFSLRLSDFLRGWSRIDKQMGILHEKKGFGCNFYPRTKWNPIICIFIAHTHDIWANTHVSHTKNT